MRKAAFSLQFLIIISLLSPVAANATPDESFGSKHDEELKTPRLPSARLFDRLQSVYKYFSLAPEVESQPFFQDLQGKQNLENIVQILPYLDPTNSFDRFYSLQNQKLIVYQDLSVKTVKDYEVELASKGTQEPVKKISDLGTPEKPLAGIRIAIDPGHMGSDYWDKETGKYIVDHKGHKLSEGVLTLQVALLLEKELQALGAEVFVTRRDFVPVTTLSLNNFDFRAFAREKMRDSNLDNWFQNLLTSTPLDQEPDDVLYGHFVQSPYIKKMFSEFMRGTYYVQEADVQARAQNINLFKPDIALMIHFDAAIQVKDPQGINSRHFDRTKAYVLGGFAFDEMGTREARRNFGRVLLNRQTWESSLGLARSIVASFDTNMGIGPDSGHDASNINVEKGVIARNLEIIRLIEAQASSLVECLYYNDPQEFDALLAQDHFMTIGGNSYSYSNRLIQVVQSLRDGVTNFVNSL